METFRWAELIGGLAFFFYGLRTVRGGLQLMAGGRLKAALGRITSNRFAAMGFGTLVTLILQSSSATTVMLVSLAATELLTLTQAFGVILGADIGTTFVVIILSIKKVTDYALVIVAIGFAIQWLAKRHKTKHTGSVILGFGLLFFGMHLMSSATAPLRENPTAIQIFEYLALHPLANLIIATIFTAIIQASAATIGIAISLSFAGLINFESAIPIVLGANIGTCITAFLGSLGTGVNGRRVAVAHTMVKVFGVAIVFPFIAQIAYGVNLIEGNLVRVLPFFTPQDSGKIALIHLLFNIVIALVFIPFIKQGVLVVKKLVPQPKGAPKPFGPKYLDKKALDTPVLAFAQTKREILRVASLAYELFKDALKIFEKGPEVRELIEEFGDRDDKIDLLDKAIRFYLAELSIEQLTDEQAAAQSNLFTITRNLEEIGDIISKDLTSLALKKWEKQRVFSTEGWKELKQFHKLVLENFDLTISILTSPHPEVAQKILRHQQHLYNLEQEYRQAHVGRLHIGFKETFETSSIHLDLLSSLRRINGLLTYVARVVIEET